MLGVCEEQATRQGNALRLRRMMNGLPCSLRLLLVRCAGCQSLLIEEAEDGNEGFGRDCCFDYTWRQCFACDGEDVEVRRR